MDISKETLKQVLVEQREGFLRKETGVERELLAEAASLMELPHVVVITGLRRCGKSTLLRQIAAKYLDDARFFYVNFEDERLIGFPAGHFQDILEAQVELFGNQKIFLVDEIQQNEGFESYVRRLTDQGYKFVITGSNARLLSSEISTKLTGRHTDITLYPFSFSEYLNLKNISHTGNNIYRGEQRALIRRGFGRFLANGSMPEYTIFNDDEIIFRMYEDIIYKDIAVRHKITNVRPMRELYHYLVSNICRPFSYRNLTRVTGIESPVTVRSYIDYLEQTYFIRQVSKFDFSIKKQLVNNKKVYVIDNAFFRKLSFSFSGDKGWLLENLVANALAREGELFYFEGKQACDFILKKQQSFTAFQVTLELNDQNREREVSGLMEAMAALDLDSGHLITLDEEGEWEEGKYRITMLPAWKWMLEGGGSR